MLGVEQVEERDGYNATEVYKCLTEPDISVFNEEENESRFDRIVKKYGHLTGKQLEELSHAEAPYIGTELGKKSLTNSHFIVVRTSATHNLWIEFCTTMALRKKIGA